jgi:hypothetical protein
MTSYQGVSTNCLHQAWAKLAPNIKLAPALQPLLQPLLFQIMARGLLYLTDNGQT